MKVSNTVDATTSYDHMVKKESVKFGDCTVTVFSHTSSDFPGPIAPFIEAYKQLYCTVVDHVCNGPVHYTCNLIEYIDALTELDKRYRAALLRFVTGESTAFEQEEGGTLAFTRRINGFVKFVGECQYRELCSLIQLKLTIFRDLANGWYPLRSANGDSIKIKRLGTYPIAPGSAQDLQRPHLECKNVVPFIKQFESSGGSRKLITESERGELYSAMACRRIEAADLPDSRESSLIGQNGVFALRTILKGTCLGVYGGTLIRGKALRKAIDMGDNYIHAASRLDERGIPVFGISGGKHPVPDEHDLSLQQ